MILYFIKDGFLHRIISKELMIKEKGYKPSPETFNIVQVQKKRLFLFKRWFDLEFEHVPAWAWISSSVLGYCEWESNLIKKYEDYILDFKNKATGGMK